MDPFYFKITYESFSISSWFILVAVIAAIMIYCLLRWFCLYMKRLKQNEQMEESIIQKSCTDYEKRRLMVNCPQPVSCKWWHKARIYQIIIDRFDGGWQEPPVLSGIDKDEYAGGTLKGIIERLDYIKDHGYNTILLSPIFESNAYHGYHTINYEKVDSHFGSWDDFLNLINAAHKREIKIICDFVPNHCHENNLLFQDAISNKDSKYRKWFYFKGTASSDYVSFLNYPNLPKFNLCNEDAADYMINVATMLVYFGVDGLRIDHIIGLPFEFVKKLYSTIKSINSEVFIFGEATAMGISEFSQIQFITDEHRKKANNKNLSRDELQMQYSGIVDGVLDFEFQEMIVEELAKGNHLMGNLELTCRIRKHFESYSSCFLPVLFLDNHDLDRIMFHCRDNKELVKEAVHYIWNLPHPLTIYYGTEQYMTNKPSIINAEPYADLRVRNCMDWSDGHEDFLFV